MTKLRNSSCGGSGSAAARPAPAADQRTVGRLE